MKNLLLILFSVCFFSVQATDTLTVYMRPNKSLFIRTNWDDKKDLLLLCIPGWNNQQFNFNSTFFIPKTQKTEALRKNFKLPPRFHWCGDSTGVIHMYSNAKRSELYILSGNHGYNGTTITLPGHNFTKDDIGKKFKGKYYIAKINSKDSFSVLPKISKKEIPEAESLKPLVNFRGTRIPLYLLLPLDVRR